MRVHRSQILGAEYNPRYITEQAKKKLGGGIKKLGLLGPIIWNKRTGNCVGGHQRLSRLDARARSKDYDLTVAVVDLTPEQEVSANILLNNPEAQGEWDFEKLRPILESPTFDHEAAGMGAADIYKIIGESASAEVLEEVAGRIDSARDIAATVNETRDEKNTDYYLVVVFKDHRQRLAFTDGLGLDDNRFVNGDELARELEIDLNPPASDDESDDDSEE